MKRIFTILSIICFCATFAVAQKNKQRRAKSKSINILTNQISTDSSQNNQPNSAVDENKSQPINTPLKIIEKPSPILFRDGQNCSQGKVVLRVTFLKSGEIGTISVISSLTKSKTESAVEAAKKIKFEPATRNGIPFSVTKPVEYSFTIY